MWQALRGRQLGVKFRRQVILANVIVDFYAHEVRLAIEVDGSAHRGREAHDRQRDAYLAAHGVRTLRVKAWEVERGLDGVIARVAWGRRGARELEAAEQLLAPALIGARGRSSTSDPDAHSLDAAAPSEHRLHEPPTLGMTEPTPSNVGEIASARARRYAARACGRRSFGPGSTYTLCKSMSGRPEVLFQSL